MLELQGITKRYPGVVACDDIDMDLVKGEIHALLGENGAGKSTLMNVLYGMTQPDEGEIRVGGRRVEMTSPSVAIANGIGMVHQHFMLVPVMTVAENIVLALEPNRGRVILDRAKAEADVAELSERFGLIVDPTAAIEDISVGQQQRVEILKALYRGAEILILDEPTAVLTPQEAQELEEILRNLTAEGKGVIFITHKLHEVTDVADRVTVIRRGKKIDTRSTQGLKEKDLAELMVGRAVSLTVDKAPAKPGAPLLEIKDLVVHDDRELEAVKGISVTVAAGEIVGIAGVDGNGQAELIDALTGLRSPTSGQILLEGKDLTDVSPKKMFQAGMGHIPTDRQLRGLVLSFDLSENIAIHDYDTPPESKWGWMFPGNLRARANRLIDEFDIRGGNPRSMASSLSGGNQQKVVIAREIDGDPKILVAAQPTRGVDVGAIEFLHQRLVEERDEGRGILLISLELDEILSLSDRILVISGGTIVGEYEPGVTREELGRAMLGSSAAQ